MTHPSPEIHGDDLVLDDETRAALPPPTTMTFVESELIRLYREREEARQALQAAQDHIQQLTREIAALRVQAAGHH